MKVIHVSRRGWLLGLARSLLVTGFAERSREAAPKLRLADSDSHASAPAEKGDEGEIRAVAVRQGEEWSRHDAKAYAALFTQDCDVINV